MRLNVAAYYSKYDDIQKTQNRTVNGMLRTETVNAAKATIYGLEAEGALNLGDHVQLSASYTFTHAAYDSFITTEADFTDRPFGYLPKHKVTGSARFSLPAGDGEVAFQPTVAWQSGQFVDDVSAFGTYQPAYAVVNARLEWSPSERLTVATWAQNLFNKKYNVAGVGLWESLGFSIVYPGEPRMYGLELSAKF